MESSDSELRARSRGRLELDRRRQRQERLREAFEARRVEPTMRDIERIVSLISLFVGIARLLSGRRVRVSLEVGVEGDPLMGLMLVLVLMGRDRIATVKVS